MASLRDMVSEYQDDLRNGIAWLAFWREGRSWQAEAFHLDLDDTLYPEDRARLAEIQAADPQAVVVNGYYSGYLGEEMNVAELAAGVRHHYDNDLNNIAPFMEAHSDELPPDVLKEAREKAHAAGLPFYERPYRFLCIHPLYGAAAGGCAGTGGTNTGGTDCRRAAGRPGMGLLCDCRPENMGYQRRTAKPH